ncbi:hypothetical protein LZQ00_06190 [Sphingobacterium sp. SRCM116780]|uniref:hypothetical protein n=1 Tax=Sphingobacterium sp. SRCM116780 TaxID=2907623 RepID=UPI001F31E3F2|nr:hypothetical protein [Sphingobacterium sp. SRCM116780]UIR57403.1 hypothetical protein LZQ00_06190 [Sphingobacterium sp. SRCM116780]
MKTSISTASVPVMWSKSALFSFGKLQFSLVYMTADFLGSIPSYFNARNYPIMLNQIGGSGLPHFITITNPMAFLFPIWNRHPE